MSRHFNYELNEKRIKNLLQDNSLPYREELWSEYLEKFKGPVKSARIKVINPTPFAINKSVVISVGFIALLLSVTLLIAHFADFSSAAKADNSEKQLIPEASNFKGNLPVSNKGNEHKNMNEEQLLLATDTAVVDTQPIIEIIDNAPPVNENKPSQATEVAAQPASNSQEKNSGDDSLSTAKNTQKKNKKKQVETMETKPVTIQIPTITEEEEPELRK